MDTLLEQAESICSVLSDWMGLSCFVDCIEMEFVYESLMELLGKSVLTEKDLADMTMYIEMFGEFSNDICIDSDIWDESELTAALVS